MKVKIKDTIPLIMPIKNEILRYKSINIMYTTYGLRIIAGERNQNKYIYSVYGLDDSIQKSCHFSSN